jgi:hypothetical protein
MINAIGSGTSLSFGIVFAAGQVPDPVTRQEQVNATADLLQAVRGVNLPGIAAARMSDGKGIDLYL